MSADNVVEDADFYVEKIGISFNVHWILRNTPSEASKEFKIGDGCFLLNYTMTAEGEVTFSLIRKAPKNSVLQISPSLQLRPRLFSVAKGYGPFAVKQDYEQLPQTSDSQWGPVSWRLESMFIQSQQIKPQTVSLHAVV